MRFHDSPPVIKSKKLSTKLFGLCSDESIISHWMILNRYLLFCVYLISVYIILYNQNILYSVCCQGSFEFFYSVVCTLKGLAFSPDPQKFSVGVQILSQTQLLPYQKDQPSYSLNNSRTSLNSSYIILISCFSS